MPSRRHFLRAAMAAAGTFGLDASSVARVLAQDGRCGDALPPGELLGTLPLTGDRPRQTPYGEPVGGPGLDTRVFTDLSNLSADRLITPANRVFVRTAAPAGIDERASTWQVALGTGVAAATLEIDELRRSSRPQGAHLIECAGNNDPDNFGLLSVADWDGVPLEDLLPRLSPGREAYGVLVSGVDDEAPTARSSVPGASWILPVSDLPRLGAFLATRMNGEPLQSVHGAPVRLVVPGWYGCAWIKWVRELRVVGADAEVTTQMAEFAGRTHQNGRPVRADAYEAPVIDLAATPVRVERWRVNGALEYRVVGIVWGGQRPPTSLAIRFGSREPWTTFDVCPAPSAPRTWSLWSYRWNPSGPGLYNIALASPDRSVRTRRLDMFFYSRRVRVEEV
jgi:DMSO/TMAO reductase YedYZ molybdopterin-dependent catalytic subunit